MIATPLFSPSILPLIPISTPILDFGSAITLFLQEIDDPACSWTKSSLTCPTNLRSQFRHKTADFLVCSLKFPFSSTCILLLVTNFLSFFPPSVHLNISSCHSPFFSFISTVSVALSYPSLYITLHPFYPFFIVYPLSFLHIILFFFLSFQSSSFPPALQTSLSLHDIITVQSL